MDIPLEFTTTAMCRPEILEKTYYSFSTRLKGIDFSKSTLFINVDPLPIDCDPLKVIDVANKFFGKVISNISSVPNFTNAIKWCWSQPIDDYFFNLEDDWLLLRDIQIIDLIKLLKNDIMCINLRAYDFNDNRICLSPGLFNNKISKSVANKLKSEFNPEKQLRPFSRKNTCGYRTMKYLGRRFPANVVLKDIGREWLESSGYTKRNGADFIKWENR